MSNRSSMRSLTALARRPDRGPSTPVAALGPFVVAMALAAAAGAETPPPSTIVYGRPTILGSIPRELVLRVAGRRRGSIAACFAPRPGGPARPAGQLTVRFVIHPTGPTVVAEVRSSTFRSPALERCVTRAVESWDFGHGPPGINIVELPIRHAPRP